jgi:hypothetical protein
MSVGWASSGDAIPASGTRPGKADQPTWRNRGIDSSVMQVDRHLLDHFIVIEQYGHPGRSGNPRQRAIVGSTSATQPQPPPIHGEPGAQHRVGLADRVDPEASTDWFQQAATGRNQRCRVCVPAPIEIAVTQQNGEQHSLTTLDQRVEQAARTRLATDRDVRRDSGRLHNFWRLPCPSRKRCSVVDKLGESQLAPPRQQVGSQGSLLVGHRHRVDRRHSLQR